MEERIRVSTDWTLPLDGSFTFENDIMKFEPTTAFLFPDVKIDVLAIDLRDNKLSYISNAAAHYWINADAINKYKKLKELTFILIKKLEKELEEKIIKD